MSDASLTDSAADDPAARIERHPGTVILRTLRSCELIYDAFESSALQLRRLLLAIGDPADPHGVRGEGPNAGVPVLLTDVAARFAKFLAAGESLLAQTALLMAEPFVSEEHRAEQEAETASLFANDPSRAFMRDFRQWSVNHKAVLSLQPAGARGGPEVVMDPMGMLGWARWSSLARRFLHQHQPMLRLLPVTDESCQRTRMFYQRFLRRFRSRLAEPMASAKALMEEIYGPPGMPMMMSFP